MNAVYFAGVRGRQTKKLFLQILMKTSLSLCLLLISAVIFAGCASSPSSRIKKNQALFDSYPADVQEAIRKGEVRVGFTSEQTRFALGEPDQVVTRTSDAGESQAWIYRKQKSRLGVGLGVGVGSGPVGGGVGVSSSGRGSEDQARVIFVAGRVTAVEQAGR